MSNVASAQFKETGTGPLLQICSCCKALQLSAPTHTLHTELELHKGSGDNTISDTKASSAKGFQRSKLTCAYSLMGTIIFFTLS
jgi:hypothetical protein